MKMKTNSITLALLFVIASLSHVFTTEQTSQFEEEFVSEADGRVCSPSFSTSLVGQSVQFTSDEIIEVAVNFYCMDDMSDYYSNGELGVWFYAKLYDDYGNQIWQGWQDSWNGHGTSGGNDVWDWGGQENFTDYYYVNASINDWPNDYTDVYNQESNNLLPGNYNLSFGLMAMWNSTLNQYSNNSISFSIVQGSSNSGGGSGGSNVDSDSDQESQLDLQSENDNDGDGISNDVDVDDDNDCIEDADDLTPLDYDEDGINDHEDDDDDGDGINDREEVNDSDPNTNIYDYDNDGSYDCYNESNANQEEEGEIEFEIGVDSIPSQICVYDLFEIDSVYVHGLNANQIIYIEWELLDSNGGILYAGAKQLTTDASGSVEFNYNLESDSFLPGDYVFMINPADENLSNLFNDSPYYFNFSIVDDCNNNEGVCGSNEGLTTLSVDNDANKNTYMGHEYFATDDNNMYINLNCLIVGQEYHVDYKVRQYYSGQIIDQGWWNFTATSNSAFETRTWSGLNAPNWYTFGARIDYEDGTGLSDWVPFYINGTNKATPLGTCSFNFTISPDALYPGETVTATWTMTGDIPDTVRLAGFSTAGGQWNVDVQYHHSMTVQNTYSHDFTLPSGLDPDRDYYMYITSEFPSGHPTHCWKYGSFDVLEEEETTIDDLIDEWLNTPDKRPRISMWPGKVNQHNENGTWMTDPDGTAGGGNYAQWGSDGWGDRKLEYCQRFWPDTAEIRLSEPEEIVFYTRYNIDAYLSTKPVWLCVQDTDGDGVLDPEDTDDDNDGWPDLVEVACLSDELDSSIMPVDSNGDGICDVLENIIDNIVLPGQGVCDGQAINEGISNQTTFKYVYVVEQTSILYEYKYDITDVSAANPLYEDIAQTSNLYDFRGYYEYYDVFVSNDLGEYDENGGYVTIQAKTDLSTQDGGVGFNIDSVALVDVDGNALYASEIVNVELGQGLVTFTDGKQNQILGPSDSQSTRLGNDFASITVGFCGDLSAVSNFEEGELGLPAIGLLPTLIVCLLGVAFAQRRKNSDE